jgi:hypothetical protein
VSKVVRFLGALAVATATVPFLGVGPAAAADTTVSPSTTGYFYAEGVRKPDESPAAPPNLTGQHADGVAAGNLAVAAQGGTEDKVSFLLFDLLDVPAGSVVSKATLTLPLVDNAPPDNVSYGQDPAKVRACAAGDEGFNGDDGQAIQDAPARKCDVFAAPTKATADAKSYVVDITKLAQTWVDTGNDGVALTAAEGAATTPFQVVFGPAEKIKLAVSYSAATVAPPLTTPVSAPDLGAGLSGGVAPAPTVDSGFGTVGSPTVPVAPAPAPGVAPAAVPAQVAAAPVQTRPIALSTSSRPTNQFWLGGLLLAVVLGLLSLIMGDTTVAAASSRPSRLARALSERQRGNVARPAFGRTATT